jgi:DNA gyrase/topoisomerase IV subunit B
MYVGDYHGNEYNSAPMNLLREVVGNCLDEFMNGHVTTIHVHYDVASNKMRVRDDGRGIPYGTTTYTDPVSKTEIEIDKLYLATGVANTGGKYDKGDGKSFKFAIGMNGIGIKAVNALSERFRVWSNRGEQRFAVVSYSKGELIEDIRFITDCAGLDMRGTTVEWELDQTILPFQYNLEHVKKYLHEVAYLNAGVFVELAVEDRGVKITQFHEPTGLVALAAKLTEGYDVIVNFPPLHGQDEKGSKFEVNLKVLDSPTEITLGFVNGSSIESGSLPVARVRQAYAQALQQRWKEVPKSKKDSAVDIRPDDLRSGLVAIVKILHVDPSFDSQSKTKLTNPDIASAIYAQLPALIQSHLLANPHEEQSVMSLALKAAHARLAAQKAREAVYKQSAAMRDTSPVSFHIYTPPLKDDPDNNALYMFEGQSASGALVTAAKNLNPATGQPYKNHVGILALRGSVLNTLEQDMEKALANKELATLIKVSGLNPVDPSDLSKLKFKKFIITTDMDPGGAHICTLLVSFFLAHFPEIIRQGMLYRVITPLFEVTNLKTKQLHFIYHDEDRRAALETLGFRAEDSGKTYTIKRNKGLGEGSPQAMLTLVENPRLVSFQTDDIGELHQLYHIFSGKKEVETRRNLIFERGLVVEEV